MAILGGCPDCRGRIRVGGVVSHDDTCPFARELDKATDDDVAFFKNFPSEVSRERPLVRAERRYFAELGIEVTDEHRYLVTAIHKGCCFFRQLLLRRVALAGNVSYCATFPESKRHQLESQVREYYGL